MGIAVEVGLNTPSGDYYALPADRMTLWQPGVTYNGGIPARTTQYGSALSPTGGDDAAQINAALAACTVGQHVKLNAGTFKIDSAFLDLNRSGITLRGAGATTILEFSRTDGPAIYAGNRYGNSVFYSSHNLSANATKGAYSVTVASIPAFSAGEIVLIDQLTDDTVTVWSINSPLGDASRTWCARENRPTCQLMEVDHVDGSTVYFTTPFRLTYKTALTAQISRFGDTPGGGGSVRAFISQVGIEDLKIVRTAVSGDGYGLITFNCCGYSWAKNVEVQNNKGPAINFTASYRCEERECYIHETADPNPGGGGYLCNFDWGSSDCLVEDSIHWGGNKVIVFRAAGAGCVVGYNYMDDAMLSSLNFVESGINASHMTTPHYVLFEGNQGHNFDGDSTWGNSVYVVAFRNWFTGRRLRHLAAIASALDESNRKAAGIGINHWWCSFVGNVLGTSGQAVEGTSGPFIYEQTYNASAPNGEVPMWNVGYNNTDENGDPDWNQPNDTTTIGLTIRDGNFDYVSNEVRWHGEGGDVGDGTPATLPDSLYLDSAPAFFSGYTWPWVDAVGSTKLYSLPARARFFAIHGV